jgi:alpha-2-macroglobulin
VGEGAGAPDDAGPAARAHRSARLPVQRGPGHSTLVRVSRSNRSGRLYYAPRLAYYPRVNRVGPLARGVTITRQYLYRGRPVTAAPVGAVLRVRLTVRSVQDLCYYVRIEDPLPAGAEAVDPTLRTTSQLYSGGCRVPPHTSDLGWYVSHVELRDDRAALIAPYLPAGVYRYEYTVQLTTRMSNTHAEATTHSHDGSEP